MNALSQRLPTRLATEPPSRELDAEIARKILGKTVRRQKGDPELWIFHRPGYSQLPHYTASFDAALAVFRERLPGWQATLYAAPNYSIAELEPNDWPERSLARVDRHNDHLAMALLAAVAKAEGW